MYRILVTAPTGAEAKQRSAREDEPHSTGTNSRSQYKAANVSLELDGELSGLTLCGFSIWSNGPHGLRVSLPTRRFVTHGGGRGSFLILRATDVRNRAGYDRLKNDILDAYYAFAHARPIASPTEVVS